MPVFLNPHDLAFPSPEQADEHGIVALGGDLRPERLLAAYAAGIFPWPHEGFPLLWFSPDPRFVLVPQKIRINLSLKKALKKTRIVIKADHNFLAVMKACQKTIRPDQDSTWITKDMIDNYYKLFELGYAHSVEAYEGDELVGGLYGVSIGSIFFGESMFFRTSYASKICLVSLAAHLRIWGFSLIDCQAQTQLLGELGAEFLSRRDFLEQLKQSHNTPTRKGPWQFFLSLTEALAMCCSDKKPD